MTGPFKTDMQRVRQRKRDMVEAEVAADLENYKTSGAELIMGTGRFVAQCGVGTVCMRTDMRREKTRLSDGANSFARSVHLGAADQPA